MDLAFMDPIFFKTLGLSKQVIYARLIIEMLAQSKI